MDLLNAKWITGTAAVPVFFTEFASEKPVRATLVATACGVYEAQINGKAVSSDLLSPGSYEYSYATDTRTEPMKYTMDSTIARLTQSPLFIAGVERMMPGAGKNLTMDFLQSKTLGELTAMMPAGASAAFEMILKQMNAEEKT